MSGRACLILSYLLWSLFLSVEGGVEYVYPVTPLPWWDGRGPAAAPSIILPVYNHGPAEQVYTVTSAPAHNRHQRRENTVRDDYYEEENNEDDYQEELDMFINSFESSRVKPSSGSHGTQQGSSRRSNVAIQDSSSSGRRLSYESPVAHEVQRTTSGWPTRREQKNEVGDTRSITGHSKVNGQVYSSFRRHPYVSNDESTVNGQANSVLTSAIVTDKETTTPITTSTNIDSLRSVSIPAQKKTTVNNVTPIDSVTQHNRYSSEEQFARLLEATEEDFGSRSVESLSSGGSGSVERRQRNVKSPDHTKSTQSSASNLRRKPITRETSTINPDIVTVVNIVQGPIVEAVTVTEPSNAHTNERRVTLPAALRMHARNRAGTRRNYPRMVAAHSHSSPADVEIRTEVSVLEGSGTQSQHQTRRLPSSPQNSYRNKASNDVGKSFSQNSLRNPIQQPSSSDSNVANTHFSTVPPKIEVRTEVTVQEKYSSSSTFGSLPTASTNIKIPKLATRNSSATSSFDKVLIGNQRRVKSNDKNRSRNETSAPPKLNTNPSILYYLPPSRTKSSKSPITPIFVALSFRELKEKSNDSNISEQNVKFEQFSDNLALPSNGFFNRLGLAATIEPVEVESRNESKSLTSRNATAKPRKINASINIDPKTQSLIQKYEENELVLKNNTTANEIAVKIIYLPDSIRQSGANKTAKISTSKQKVANKPSTKGELFTAVAEALTMTTELPTKYTSTFTKATRTPQQMQAYLKVIEPKETKIMSVAEEKERRGRNTAIPLPTTKRTSTTLLRSVTDNPSQGRTFSTTHRRRTSTNRYVPTTTTAPIQQNELYLSPTENVFNRDGDVMVTTEPSQRRRPSQVRNVWRRRTTTATQDTTTESYSSPDTATRSRGSQIVRSRFTGRRRFPAFSSQTNSSNLYNRTRSRYRTQTRILDEENTDAATEESTTSTAVPAEAGAFTATSENINKETPSWKEQLRKEIQATKSIVINAGPEDSALTYTVPSSPRNPYKSSTTPQPANTLNRQSTDSRSSSSHSQTQSVGNESSSVLGNEIQQNRKSKLLDKSEVNGNTENLSTSVTTTATSPTQILTTMQNTVTKLFTDDINQLKVLQSNTTDMTREILQIAKNESQGNYEEVPKSQMPPTTIKNSMLDSKQMLQNKADMTETVTSTVVTSSPTTIKTNVVVSTPSLDKPIVNKSHKISPISNESLTSTDSTIVQVSSTTITNDVPSDVVTNIIVDPVSVSSAPLIQSDSPLPHSSQGTTGNTVDEVTLNTDALKPTSYTNFSSTISNLDHNLIRSPALSELPTQKDNSGTIVNSRAMSSTLNPETVRNTTNEIQPTLLKSETRKTIESSPKGIPNSDIIDNTTSDISLPLQVSKTVTNTENESRILTPDIPSPTISSTSTSTTYHIENTSVTQPSIHSDNIIQTSTIGSVISNSIDKTMTLKTLTNFSDNTLTVPLPGKDEASSNTIMSHSQATTVKPQVRDSLSSSTNQLPPVLQSITRGVIYNPTTPRHVTNQPSSRFQNKQDSSNSVLNEKEAPAPITTTLHTAPTTTKSTAKSDSGTGVRTLAFKSLTPDDNPAIDPIIPANQLSSLLGRDLANQIINAALQRVVNGALRTQNGANLPNSAEALTQKQIQQQRTLQQRQRQRQKEQVGKEDEKTEKSTTVNIDSTRHPTSVWVLPSSSRQERTNIQVLDNSVGSHVLTATASSRAATTIPSPTTSQLLQTKPLPTSTTNTLQGIYNIANLLNAPDPARPTSTTKRTSTTPRPQLNLDFLLGLQSSTTKRATNRPRATTTTRRPFLEPILTQLTAGSSTRAPRGPDYVQIALNITRVVSRILGAVVRGAARTLQTVVTEKARALSTIFTGAGSGVPA